MAFIRVNGRYKHYTPLLHDNEQIGKFTRTTKEDKHARANYSWGQHKNDYRMI